MKFNLIIITLLLAVQAIGQCPESSNPVTLTSQAQVDAFVADYPNCEELNSTLIIGSFGAPQSTDINDLSGFTSLRRVTGELRVRDVDLLTSFDGLHNLEYVGNDLVISNNDNLLNLNVFNRIDSIGKDFEIQGNSSLEIVFEEDSLLFIGGSLKVSRNSKLSEISGMKELRLITSNLEVVSNDSLTKTMQFDKLETIGGTLGINGNPALKNLSGFPMLTTIGNGMEIIGTAVTDFSGLENLKTVNGNFAGNSVRIAFNPALISLTGLESLDSIERGLFIDNNLQLESLDGLSNLRFIGGELFIQQSNLTDITALEGISPLSSRVNIRENARLRTLGNLPIASTINGSLEIRENAVLTDIAAVSSIDTVLGQLNIQDNVSLFECRSLCNLLSNGFVDGIITIRDNLGACQTEEDLLSECTTGSVTVAENISFEIFPNPTSGYMVVNAVSPFKTIRIFKADGTVVAKWIYTNSLYQAELEVRTLEAGHHFIELTSGDTRSIIGFLKI